LVAIVKNPNALKCIASASTYKLCAGKIVTVLVVATRHKIKVIKKLS
jgi:hypothetical protein